MGEEHSVKVTGSHHKKYIFCLTFVIILGSLTLFGTQKSFYNGSQVVILSEEEQDMLYPNDDDFFQINDRITVKEETTLKSKTATNSENKEKETSTTAVSAAKAISATKAISASKAITATIATITISPIRLADVTLKPIVTVKPTTVPGKSTTESPYKLHRRSTPHNHITFIKTHKCASSTIQNILMRYGYHHNLTFTLPKNIGNHIGWPSPFRENQIRKTIKQPDIHCYHSVFSQELLDRMPKDAVNIFAVRDPFTQMRSAYVYYSWYGASHKTLTQALDWLIANPSQRTIVGTPGYNPIMFDLGLKYSEMGDPERVEQYVNFLDKTFHFVVVTEYFSESMIILRDLLGWSNKEIASFGTNFRKEEGRAPKGVDMEDTPENREKLYKYLAADKKLYDHFRTKLEKIINANKDYIEREVAELKRYQQSLLNYCVYKALPTSQIKDTRFKTWGNGAYGYLLTPAGLNNDTCIDMAMAELAWVRRLSKYQLGLG